ncbi:monosaccharide ABC transporter membrane protein (CUT2 family) [Pseudonocardia hierapolitana]|uniref:Monosaccharide ABC transporter membrane protein (CUT2 family) n=1 Tax=Pseudonocardia hierapolitana TaxID=1128676 RepID=A0A561SWA6_9PSEU|nr:ABC transporter permease [Pseudonocardia hierapolitana]TWF79144.1 monosaccharide ABC transporter membrane protein (CUT2 family) [Pseudonocardia hierapolitana]
MTDTEVGVPTQRPAFQRLAGVSTFWIALVLVALCVLFSALRPDAFPTLFTLQTLLIEASVLLVLAVGMTFVIITAGIDLSVGSVLVFSGVVGATLMEALSGGDSSDAGVGVVLLGLLGALAGGGAWGLLNGMLVARARIPPLIVTLGSFGAALGAAQLITDGVDVRTVPRVLRDGLGFGQTAQVPHMVALAAVVTLAGAWLLHTTRFGRRTFAVGSNAEAARRAGIPVQGHLVRVYTGVGLLSGLAGFMSLAYFGTTTISGHSTDNLNAIAAVVLGGTSLFGGVGTVFGTVIGVFIPAVLTKGFVIVGVQQFWQPVAISAVLVAAVWFDQVRRRSRDSR